MAGVVAALGYQYIQPYVEKGWAEAVRLTTDNQSISIGIFGSIFFLLGLNCAYILITGVPPLRSGGQARKIILEEVKGVKKGTIYDLGAGYGSLAVPLARAHRELEVVAVELSPLCCVSLRFWKLLYRLKNLKIVRKDFFEMPIKDAGAVTLYLTDKTCKRINLKLERELAKGTVVVSNSFALPEWVPERVEYAKTGGVWPHVYVYKAPGCRPGKEAIDDNEKRREMRRQIRRIKTVKALVWPIVTAVTFAVAIWVKLGQIQYS